MSFVTIAGILVLSVFLGEKDFGFFKLPLRPWAIRRWLRFVAPGLLFFAVTAFVPVFPADFLASVPSSLISGSEVHFVADDLTLQLTDPYEHRQFVLQSQVRVEVAEGAIALTRQAELVSSYVDTHYFVSESYFGVRLLSAKPDRIVVSSGGSAVISVEFDTSSLIPLASFVTSHEVYTGTPFGSLKVAITYSDRGRDKKAIIEIPMRFSN